MSVLRQIKTLHFPAFFEHYSNSSPGGGTPSTVLRNIGDINLFVGPNSSGKSRFLRAMSLSKSFAYTTEGLGQQAIGSEFQTAMEALHRFQLQNKVSDLPAIRMPKDDSLPVRLESPTTDVASIVATINSIDALGAARDITVAPATGGRKVGAGRFLKPHAIAELDQVLSETKSKLDDLLHRISSDQVAPERYYIPTLRGLRPIAKDSAGGFSPLADIYEERTRSDYFNPKPADAEAPQIFTGQSIYERLRKALLGPRAGRQRVADFESFLSRDVFNGKEFSIRPLADSDTVLVSIGGGEEREIHHLGDGIQSVIILTFLPFITTEPSFFFIEEPETGLHPGYMREVVGAWKNTPHVYFATTHSSHLLGLSIEQPGITVTKFLKDEDSDKAKFQVTEIDGPDHSALEILGVRNSSVFLVNATIWVEGVTDRLYLRAYLKMCQNHLEKAGRLDRRVREDLDYAFVEYGGSSLVHWSFLNRENHPIEVQTLCAEAFLVVDRDSPENQSKADRIEQLSNELGPRRFSTTPGREIENTLPAAVIRIVVGRREAGCRDTEFDPNALDLQEEAYRDQKLGPYLAEKAGAAGGVAKYSGTYGALERKTAFCDSALEALEDFTFETLRADVQEFVVLILNHVRSKNGLPRIEQTLGPDTCPAA